MVLPRIALASVLLVPLIAGCGRSRNVVIEASGLTAPAAAATRRCSSASGYTVHYPATWSTVQDGAVPCRFFHPEPFVLPPSTEAAGLAINVQVAPAPFDDIVPRLGTGSATAFEEILSRRNEHLSGHRAVRIESRTRQAGLRPTGVRRVTWYVDAGGGTLVATTAEGASAGAFPANVDVLDDIVAAVELRPGLPLT